MSRTIRRKHTDGTHIMDEKWYTHDFSKEGYEEISSYCRWVSVPRVPLPKKEFKKGWWKFHNDHLLSFCDFRWTWKQVRAKNQTDLIRWVKNEDHEVIFFEDLNKKDWN